jgi:hypothetical protein
LHLHVEQRLMQQEEVPFNYGAQMEQGCLSLLLEGKPLRQAEVHPPKGRPLGQRVVPLLLERIGLLREEVPQWPLLRLVQGPVSLLLQVR